MTSNAVLSRPDFHTAPEYTRTLGPEVAELCDAIGFAPYPEQRILLDDLFALDAYGHSAAFEVAVVVARQQMKTGFLKQAALGWLFVTDQPLVIWSAHEFGTAQEAFRDMHALIAGSDVLSRRVKKITTGNGDEAIELTSGARIRFKARTSGGGRGMTGHKVILDEAYALQPEHTSALLPTLIAVPDGQVVYGSSAGLARSEILRELRDRGRTGSRRLAYTEWCAERRDCRSEACSHRVGTPGCAMDDEVLWRAACPVTARLNPDMEPIRVLRNAMSPDGFARECLGWWDDPTGESPISESVWSDMLDPESSVDVPRFALDVSPGRDWACIVAAGPSGDATHVEVTSNAEDVDYREGVGWTVPRVLRLRDRFPDGFTVTIGGGTAAESVVPDLEAAGVVVERVTGADVPAACGLFFDSAVLGRLRHLGQAPLTRAVMAARRKDVGDRTFVWGRRSSTDITPLYAATLAVWASRQTKPVPNVW